MRKVQLSVADATAGEGQDLAFVVTLSPVSGREVTFSYSLSPGTATPGSDYTEPSGSTTVTIPAGMTTTTIYVPTIVDNTDDGGGTGMETMSVTIFNSSNADIGRSTATGTILDAIPPGITVSTTSLEMMEPQTTTFTVRLATEPTHAVQVAVTSDDTGAATVSPPTLDFSTTDWDTAQTVTVRAQGDSNSDDETVTISLSATSSDADYQGKTASVAVAVTDDDIPGVISIQDASATEGDAITFTVTLESAASNTITFDIDTMLRSGDTAEANDFTSRSGRITLAPGVTSTTFTVQTQDDGHNLSSSVYEGDETFTVTISNLTNAEISRANATGTIIDDEDVPTASFALSSRRYYEGAGTVHNALIIDISHQNEKLSQLSLIVSGTAVADEDYVALPQTITLSQSQTQKVLSISIIDDSLFEDSQTIEIRIAAASDNIQVDPTANTMTVYIDDNDTAPNITASAQDGTEGGQNAGNTPIAGQDLANVVFELNVDAPHQATITMRVETIEKTAIAGLDYQEPPTSVTFEPGETTKYIKVPVIDDDQYERRGNETFTLRLYRPNHPVLGSDRELRITGRIIDNEEPGPVPEGDYVTADRNTGAYIDVGESWLNGNPVPGRIEEMNDQDWYSTSLKAGRYYQIEIRGKTDAEREYPAAEELTLSDPYLNGVYRADGVYLPGTTNDDGGMGRSALHTIRFNKTATYYIAVSHAWYDVGGTFDLSVINLGTRTTTCTEVDVDNLTYKPGTFDSK